MRASAPAAVAAMAPTTAMNIVPELLSYGAYLQAQRP